MYNSRICPDGRKIVVTSGIEIAQNDRQVNKEFIQTQQINIFNATSSQSVNYTRNPHPATNGILGHSV